MQVSEVSLMRRRNLGNYEHVESMVKVALVEGESADKAIELAKEVLGNALGLATKKKVAQVKTTTNAAAPTTNSEEVEEAIEKVVAKKEKKVKAPKKEKVVITKEDVTNALRAYAKAKASKEMAAAVILDVTKVKTLAEVKEKDYGKLVKALKV